MQDFRCVAFVDSLCVHFKGTIRAGRDGSIPLEITDITTALKRDTDLLLQHTGRSRLKEAAPDPSLKQLYHQHCRRLLEQLLPEFMEGTFEGIEADLEQAAELREITRLKDMRFIFQSRQQRMLQDFQAQFQANQASLSLCLLYTSPSPRDRTRSRMPSSA